MIHCHQQQDDLDTGLPCDVKEAIDHVAGKFYDKFRHTEQIRQQFKIRQVEHICLLLGGSGRSGHHDLSPQNGDDNTGGNDHREKEGGPEEGVALKAAAEHHSDQQAEHQNDRHFIDHGQQRFCQIRQEVAITGEELDKRY